MNIKENKLRVNYKKKEMKKPSLIALTTLFLGGQLTSFGSFNSGVQSVKLIE